MTSYTAHTKPDCPPILTPEGWSLGAAIFGPFWLLAYRAWIPAVLFLAVVLLVQLLTPPALGAVISLGLGVLSGLLARDAVRWSLERQGYELTEIVVARDHEGALARLLHARPDLRADALEQLA